MAREANIRIDLDIKAAANDSLIKNVVGAIFGSKEIKQSILTNVCKLCSPRMTKAANKYISQYVLPKITKHPNIDFTRPENVDYRGALGIPKRFNYAKLRAYFKKAYFIRVTACGSSGSSISLIESKIRDIAEKAYQQTSFRTGGRKNVGRRFWLEEADLGITEVSSAFQVFPFPGETFEDFSSINKYSRSGTHIMIQGGSYDPNEWRPAPEAESIIENTFKKYLPNIERAAIKTVPSCLKQVKKNLQLALIRAQRSLQNRAKTISGLGASAGADVSQDFKSTNQNYTTGFATELRELDDAISSASIDQQIARVAAFTGVDQGVLRLQVIKQAGALGINPEKYLTNLVKTVLGEST